MTIEQLFGTLQQSVVDMWQAHLKADQHDVHVVLDDYYKDMPELVDSLIENYMGRYGKVLSYESVLNPANFTGPVEYLTTLRRIVDEYRPNLTDSELQSDADAILSLIDSTVYKLKELCNESQVEFTLESGKGNEIERLVEACKSCKKDGEEECEKSKKGKKKDGEEECETGKKVHEGFLSLKDYLTEKL